MKEIEIGEYLRLHNGIIVKWGEKQDTRIIGSAYLDCSGEYEWSCSIVKHSFNIIDLIEVGDIIQLKGEEKLKYEVLKISWSPSKGKHIHIINPLRTEGGKDIFIEDIKSILTKEQFQCMEYRLEE